MPQAFSSSSLRRLLNASRTSAPVADTQAPELTQPQSQPQIINQQSLGYCNLFSSRAQPVLDPPPTYEKALCSKQLEAPPKNESLPAYSPSIHREGVLGMKNELRSPFAASKNQEWDDAYAILAGTSLSLHRVKRPNLFSKDRAVKPGKLIKQYTLQHAELGIATDHKKTAPVPKRYVGHFIPPLARAKVFESDPHLFEPIREHVFRIRPETEQFLLCAASQVELLDWVEALCAAVDIAPPIEDRTDPRYRSLPRRNRRQRMLESNLTNDLEQLTSGEAGRQFLEQQQRIMERLYPGLMESGLNDGANESTFPDSPSSQRNDPFDEEMDPADVQPPSPVDAPEMPTFTAPRNNRFSVPVFNTAPIVPLDFSSAIPNNRSMTNLRLPSETVHEPLPRSTIPALPPTGRKPVPRNAPSEAHVLRYRRRCAPILLENSPRNSEVIVQNGRSGLARMRIIPLQTRLEKFEQLPPRYESHQFTLATKKIPLPPVTEEASAAEPAPEIEAYEVTDNDMRRPKPIHRGSSDSNLSHASITSSSSAPSLASPRTPTSANRGETAESMEGDSDFANDDLEVVDTRDSVGSVGEGLDLSPTAIKESSVRKMRMFGSMRLGTERRGVSWLS